MRVEQLGTGEPEIAIVGGIHGDEPCGVRAIERLLADPPEVRRPVKLIVANELALSRGVRYVDADLNRSFEGESSGHEHGLARDLARELAGCTAVSFHSTQSYRGAFGIVKAMRPSTESLPRRLSIDALVEVESPEGRPFALEAADLFEVEAGYQGSERAAENASRIAREFLVATGALPGERDSREVPVFRLDDPIEKPPAERYEVFVENFTRVEAGERFAAADGEALVAEEPFYPVLMSAEGYRDIFGYAADRVDSAT